MKILAVNSINANNLSKINKQTNNKLSNPVSSNILQNSISEAIGRSQVVSFKGLNSMSGPIVKHECSEWLRTKETIVYNKKDGSYIHTVCNFDGSLRTRDEFYPMKGIEVCTTVTKDGTDVKTKKPDVLIQKKTDPQGREILYKESHSDGLISERRTEFDRQRQIIKRVKGDRILEAYVLDLKTGKYATQGEIILEDIPDETDNSVNTVSILTGALYRKQKVKPNGKLQYLIEYFPETPVVSHSVSYNDRTGGYEENYFYPSGNRQSYASVSKNGKHVDLYEYKQDGKTISAHSKRDYDRYGNIEFKTDYEPYTNLIMLETEYGKNKQVITHFKKQPNVPQYADVYEGDLKTATIQFQRDGSTFKSLTEYLKNGGLRYSEYSDNGYKLYTDVYDPDNFLSEKTEFFENSSRKKKVTQYNKIYGGALETYYDYHTKLMTKSIKYDKFGKVTEMSHYHSGTEILRQRRINYSDGSYRIEYFDDKGNPTKKEDYYSDGTKKRQRRSTYQDTYTGGYQSTRHTQQTHRTKPDESKKQQFTPQREALDRIEKVLASKNDSIKNIFQADWAVLLEITELDSVSDLIHITSESFRKLSKKFHPDLNQRNSNRDDYEVVFKILNELKMRNK